MNGYETPPQIDGGFSRALLNSALSLAERREHYCRNAKPCPACGENQVQLVDWINNAKWKCRQCKHGWEGATVSESNNKYADLLELMGEVDGQEVAPLSPPFSATAGQIGNAIDKMVDQARKAGMLYEVIETYGGYRASGDNPLEAARCALYEWDC